mmetsp:Transcript_33591/g.75469  ORF Transcript_33591/g.75469 Transcript_33591/m.75469 type:complete len:290 (+) Transcript_33591:792-1661(+)
MDCGALMVTRVALVLVDRWDHLVSEDRQDFRVFLEQGGGKDSLDQMELRGRWDRRDRRGLRVSGASRAGQVQRGLVATRDSLGGLEPGELQGPRAPMACQVRQDPTDPMEPVVLQGSWDLLAFQGRRVSTVPRALLGSREQLSSGRPATTAMMVRQVTTEKTELQGLQEQMALLAQQAVTEHQGTTEIQGFLAFRESMEEMPVSGLRRARLETFSHLLTSGDRTRSTSEDGVIHPDRKLERSKRRSTSVVLGAGMCSASSRWMRWRWRCGSSDTLTSGSASGGCPRLAG